MKPLAPFIKNLFSEPKFLLIQCGRILDCSKDPDTLIWPVADKQADIIVAMGVRNEFGEREIAGVVGHYKYKPFARKWLVSINETRPYETAITGRPGKLLCQCLKSLQYSGRLNDPCNLSQVCITGE